jgi:hypothetical protein
MPASAMLMRNAKECIPLESNDSDAAPAPIAAKRFAVRVSRKHAAKRDGIQCYNVEIVDNVQQRNRRSRPPVN